MIKEKLTEIAKEVTLFTKRNAPAILTGTGVALGLSTVILAVKEPPKVVKLIEEAEEEKGEELTVPEKIKVSWKSYIPAAATGAASVVCIIGANSVNAKRNAALATAYQLSKTAFKEYKEEVIETIGEKKEKTIKDKVAKKKVEKRPVSTQNVIITEKGNTLCYDAASGRYFRSDRDKIISAVNEMNRSMLSENYISLNDFYDELDLSPTSLGDELGWNLVEGYVEVDFSSCIADDGTPCLVIDYLAAPRYDYAKLL